MKCFIALLLIPFFSFADCKKKIKVEKYNQKALPSLFTFEKKKFKSEILTITINCDLYKKINEGDVLIDESLDMNIRGSLFESPVEEVKYKVLDLNP